MSNNTRKRAPSMKTPLTFVQRNAFLIVGSVVLLFILFGLSGAWYFYHEQRDARERKSMAAAVLTDTKPVSKTRRDAVLDSNQIRNEILVDESQRQPATMVARDFVELKLNKEEQSYRTESGLAVLQKFMLASGWEEKSRYVHDAARLRPIMQRHYDTEQFSDPIPGRLLDSRNYRFEGNEILHLHFAPSGAGRNMEVALRLMTGSGYLIDWESYTGASERGWEEVLRERPTEAVLLRAMANVDDYFNYEFADELRYLCLKLEGADSSKVIYAYVPRTSKLAAILPSLFGRGNSIPLTVRIAYPSNAQSNKCAELVELVAPRWLLP